jgi:hypothetical protein
MSSLAFTAAVVLLSFVLVGLGFLTGRETERTRQQRNTERHRAYRYQTEKGN